MMMMMMMDKSVMTLRSLSIVVMDQRRLCDSLID